MAKASEDKNLANSIGLMEINTEVAIDYIAFDILRAMYRKNPVPCDAARRSLEEVKKRLADKKTPADEAANLEGEVERLQDEINFSDEGINSKIESVFEKWTGGKWNENTGKVKSTLLLGPPGQGKTTAFKEAGKKVAAALGLNYVLNPADGVSVSRKDFMFVTQEFSGENTSTTIGGIPAKTVGEDGTEYMTKLVNMRLAYARHAGGAMLLLDDFPNAAPNVQNIGLSLTDEKRFQGLNLENVYIGLTGNLGSLDGTHTTRLSTALRGRCITFYTQDELPNWIARVEQRYRDDIQDAGVVGFLKREPQFFAEMPNTRQSGGFASPRTWDNFLEEARFAIQKFGGRGVGEMRAVPEILNKASSILGLDVGLKIHAYYHSMMLGADPIAREMIQDGTFKEREFKERFKDGFSADSHFFAYQFAVALSDYAVNRIVSSGNFSLDSAKNPQLKETMQRFARGILMVNNDIFSFALDHFKGKLANQVDEWSQKVETRRSLTLEVKKELANFIVVDKNCTAEHRTTMIAALSDSNKYAGYTPFNKGKK